MQFMILDWKLSVCLSHVIIQRELSQMVPFLNSMSEVLSGLCFQVTCLGDSGYVDFLFMLNESNNISMFQICHKFVRNSVLGDTFVKVNMTDSHTRSHQRFIQLGQNRILLKARVCAVGLL